jgi:hypothetical protein
MSISNRSFQTNALHATDRIKANRKRVFGSISEAAYAELPETPGKYAIRPGRLTKSELFHRILSKDPDYIMPTPDSHLSLTNQEKALLIKWIENGAPYKPHWAFAPVRETAPPKVKRASWVRNPIDQFVLSKLEKGGLIPSQEADKEILLRRLSLDLTGLPPTADEIDEFLSDRSDKAYEKQVERLLNSPHYGEKMATGWLDLARFADSHGYTVDRLRDMSPYRDWVIGAFNRNLPYDQFLKQQLAGDLMPNPTKEMLIATAFNRNHQQNMEGGIIEEEFQTEYVVDRVNTLGDAILGISLSCAKCHDHKYDPISQKNYFELFSFFNNVREAGQISWDDAMPSPTLLLPTPTQEAHLKEMAQQIKQLEERLLVEKEAQTDAYLRWVESKEAERLLSETIPKKDLQGYYNFEAKKLKNLASSRHHGILKYNGAPVKTAPLYAIDTSGVPALQLDGDVYLDLEGAGIFRKSSPFSIDISLRIPKDLKEGVIFHKSDSERLYNFRGYHLYLKENKLEVNMAYASPSNAITRVTEMEVPKEKWLHLTLTYDGSGRADGLNLYMDGKKLALVTEIDQLTKDILFGRSVEPSLQIGAWGRGLGFKNGLVRSVAVYTRELIPFEVEILAGKSSWADRIPARLSSLTPEKHETLKAYYMSAVSEPVRDAQKELSYLRAALADSTRPIKELMIMQEYPKPKPAYVLLRGEYGNKGERVSPNTPQAILSFPEDLPKNRLGLSQWLTSDSHPLTARVAVNQFWQSMFGTGLVKTSEDFGNQGEMPSHPELLDWLAAEFKKSGWDVKKIYRLMANSATYRQDSKTTDALREKDPENRLLARGPSKRLTAEMIRDNALSASGLLKKTVGGPSIRPYQPDGLWEINSAKYRQDTGEQIYRRSLYILAKRSVPNPTLASFDATDRSYCVSRRQQTNTPLQALVTLNDPTFVEASRKMGETMAKEKDEDAAIVWAYRQATGRRPASRETALFRKQYRAAYDKIKKYPEKGIGWLQTGQAPTGKGLEPARVAAFSIVASTILNSDATLTKR